MGGLTLNMTAVLAVARELGAAGWAAAALILAIRAGMADGVATRRAKPAAD
jgi:hypothetical protein